MDNEAALLELKNVKSLVKTIGIEDTPKYKLLDNIEVDWKTVLIDVDDEEFRSLYYELVGLDTLLERIHQTSEEHIRDMYIKEYNYRIHLLLEDDQVERGIEIITQRNRESY
ncbi:hypothetical protein D3C75_711210 [compost metagenome]